MLPVDPRRRREIEMSGRFPSRHPQDGTARRDGQKRRAPYSAAAPEDFFAALQAKKYRSYLLTGPSTVACWLAGEGSALFFTRQMWYILTYD